MKIIRLIGRNTVEEIILRRADEKLKLTEKVIESGQFSTPSTSRQAIVGQDTSQVSERTGKEGREGHTVRERERDQNRETKGEEARGNEREISFLLFE